MAFGSMNNSGDDAPISDINVTPLVDVMLVLLIVFMITMPVLTHSIPLELPSASAQAAKTDKQPAEPLRITVASDGTYYFGTETAHPIGIEEVRLRLESAKLSDGNTIVAIAADKAAEYGYVNKVLGAVREAGISKVGFVTETKAQ